MAPFAKSFGQAFSQSYDAESKRRRQKEDEIAQEGRLEERMGRTRAYELGQELERESRSATRQLDLEGRAYVRAIEENARAQAEAANLRATVQSENEANADKERQRIEDEARFIAAARMPSKIPVDFRAQDWKGVVADVDKTSALRKSQAELGLPMSPYTVDLPVRYAPDEAVDPIQDAEIYKPSEADYAAVDKAQRDREEDVKEKALKRQIREKDQAFFTEASSLVPLEYQSQITNDEGEFTKEGKAFLRTYVKMMPYTHPDQVKGEGKIYERLAFIRPVVKPFTTTETPPDTTFNFDQGTNVQGSPFGSVPAEKGPTESSRFNPATGRPGSLGERRGEGTGENFPASQPERSVDQKFKAGFTDSKLSQAQRDVVESVIVDAGYKMEDVEGDYSDFARRISMSERNEAKFNLDRIYSEIDRAESSKTDIFGRKKNLSVSQKEKLESDLEKAMAELNPASSAYIEKERRFNIINSAYEKRPFMQKPKLRR